MAKVEEKLISSPDLVAKMKGSLLFQITKANKIAGKFNVNKFKRRMKFYKIPCYVHMFP